MAIQVEEIRGGEKSEGKSTPDVLAVVEELTKKIEKKAKQKSEPISRRYPLTFSLIGMVGFLAVLYGFERMLDNISFLKENPGYVLIVGIILLIITGTLYRRLQSN